MGTATPQQASHHLLARLSLRILPSFNALRIPANTMNQYKRKEIQNGRALILCCSDSDTSTSSSPSSPVSTNVPPMIRKKRRYRKQYPGESKGITEEMRFVAMRLRKATESGNDNEDRDSSSDEKKEEGNSDDDGGETWQPSMDGFLKYLVDSKLVFNTVERIVDESGHVAYAYFRKTGLERSEGLRKDIEWLCEQGFVIPKPSNPGVSYSKYLEKLAEKSAPLFLCHLYNIYYAHIAGGQVIARQVSEKLLDGRELEFYRWEGDEQDLMKHVRENLNMLGEHWSRDEKNKCLKEATKSFRFLEHIVRLIIL